MVNAYDRKKKGERTRVLVLMFFPIISAARVNKKRPLSLLIYLYPMHHFLVHHIIMHYSKTDLSLSIYLQAKAFRGKDAIN